MPPPNLDRVQPLKFESVETGGTQEDTFQTSLAETEDALSARGIYGQPAGGPADEAVAIWRDGNDWKFEDKTGGPYTLADLAASAGGGLTEPQHEALDRLTHQINESSYDQVVYSGNNVSSIVTWATAAMLLKVREEQYTYAGNRVTQAVTIQYDAVGVEKERLTEVYAYSGNKVTAITRTRV